MAFTNSSLVDYALISPHRSSRNGKAIDTITIHCVAARATVETLGNLFQKKEASSNYGIGSDGRVGMYVEEKDRSWASSNGDNDRRAVTIEVASDNTHPYAVNSQAYAKLLDLVEDICRRNGIYPLKWSTSKDERVNHKNGCNMTVHRDYANKACPGDYLYNRLGNIADEVNKRLKEDEEMTQAEFNKMFDARIAELETNSAGSWSKEAREWAVVNGVCNGDGAGLYSWPAFVTREQMVQFLYNLNEKIIKTLPTASNVDTDAIAEAVLTAVKNAVAEI